jgi:hypothetical protein
MMGGVEGQSSVSPARCGHCVRRAHDPLSGSKGIGMAIIEERIRCLNLAESDCVPVSKSHVDDLISSLKRLLTGTAGEVTTQEFSIADLPLEAAARKLNALGIQDETVLVCWPAFHEAFRMKWDDFVARFGELWHPSSDDIVMTSPENNWILEITHEEIVRLSRPLTQTLPKTRSSE